MALGDFFSAGKSLINFLSRADGSVLIPTCESMYMLDLRLRGHLFELLRRP